MKTVRLLSVVAAAGMLLGSAPSFAKGRLVAAADKAQLVLDIAPASTVIYVDGQRRGTGATLKQLTLAPGAHIFRLVNNGDEHEDQVIVAAGKKTTFSWKFEDDRQATQQTDDDNYIQQKTAAAVQ